MNIQGAGISLNKGQGKIRLIQSIKDFSKIKNGEIVVTQSATPDFVLILNKAKCIVADEGGITSHIAIVCRELKKSAIVGTKIASKKLKNGQLVEYDCGIGLIKTIS